MLPTQGDFKLVELKFAMTPEGKRLAGLTSYQLAIRWALTVLDQGDEPIVGKITGYGSLNRDQKNAVRQALKDQFMRQVWEMRPTCSTISPTPTTTRRAWGERGWQREIDP